MTIRTWLFGLTCLLFAVWAKAMRPIFRAVTKRAPVTKTLARRFSTLFSSSAKDNSSSDIPNLMDVFQDQLKYAFDLELPKEMQEQVSKIQQAREVHNIPSQLPFQPQYGQESSSSSSKKVEDLAMAAPRQIVVGYMDIDPQQAAEKNSSRMRGQRNHWVS